MSRNGYEEDEAKMSRLDWYKCKHTQIDLATEANITE